MAIWAKVSIFFFPGKDIEPLTRTFSRFAQKIQIMLFVPVNLYQNEKKIILWVSFEKIQIHTMPLDFFVMKMVI